MLKTIRLLCITVSAGRSRSVKNAADITALLNINLSILLVFLLDSCVRKPRCTSVQLRFLPCSQAEIHRIMYSYLFNRASAFCCARACKKQVPAFFKAHLYSNAQKALQESGGKQLDDMPGKEIQ